MVKKFLIFLSAFFSINIGVEAKKLPLPSSFKDLPVYYEAVKQIDGWSCGYNALYNACCLEKRFGRKNPNSDLNIFKQCCMAYLRNLRQDPKAAASNKILENLATPLQLSRVHYLTFERNGKIVPLFLTSTKITYPSGTHPRIIDRLMEEAKTKRAENLIESLKRELDRHATIFMLHFLCHIQTDSQGHAVLASIVKNNKGEKSIYIFDNMNNPISQNSQMKHYIDYLCSKFDIKSKYNRARHIALGASARNR